ncbi:hypothetical protein [Qaidamihabitans albus]|uniref:hypothetical protein n=1 Tax=Qaidamihabitans albus TaxID=2795733 RepID=UPI0018F18F25|nr:hypothetical protein [Qaidamihabitans albus]
MADRAVLERRRISSRPGPDIAHVRGDEQDRGEQDGVLGAGGVSALVDRERGEAGDDAEHREVAGGEVVPA